MKPFEPTAQISRHFTYSEALFLNTWNRMARESDGLTDQVIENIASLLSRVDHVLDRFGWRARVHCCYRPDAYNRAIKGAKNSAHKADRPGIAAIDFDPIGVNCEIARQQILSTGLLEELGLRCEDNGPDAGWIHLDSAPVPAGGHRYFKP